MIRKNQAIGAYLPIDENGYIINSCSWENIPLSLHVLLEKVILFYRDQFKEKLHSIYMRGSVPRGFYQEDYSDIDTFALVLEENIRWQALPLKNTQFEQSKPPIELAISSYSTNLAQDYPALAMQLKTQALCIWGNNLQTSLPKYSINSSLCFHYRWWKQDYNDFQKKEQHSFTEIQAFMKLILRVGMELVLVQEQRYSPDLYYCYQSFSQQYPNYQKSMEQILLYYLNPHLFEMIKILPLCEFLTIAIKNTFNQAR